MNAAIYCRKSTEQKVAEEAKSVTRQTELAREFAESRGWTVAAGHVYTDDAVSGAAFGDEGRPALAAMMVAAERKEFGAVVTMDESRIGRDQYRSAFVLQQLHDAGCEVWYYQEDGGRRVEMDSAVGKFMESVRGFGAELEREKGSARARETALRIAKGGNVAGNRLFGYRNERVGAFVRRVKDPEQAAAVLRIFTLYANGLGDRGVRDLFNAEGIPAPRHPAKWSETTIRDLLTNDTYRGVLVYNRTRAVMRKGREAMEPRPEAEWVRVDAPELRIVPEDLWERASARRQRRREIYRRGPLGHITGRTSGEDRRGLLLSGFLRCGVCGGNIWAEAKVRGPKKSRRLVRRWGCAANIARGPSACANDTRVLDAWMEHKVVEAVRRGLDPAEVAETMRAALAGQKAGGEDRKARRGRLEREQAEAEKQEGNLTKAIAAGGELDALVAALRAAQARRREIQAELDKGGNPVSEAATVEAARHRATVALEFLEFTRDAGKVAAARSTLRVYLPEALRCFPERDGERSGFRFEGMLAVGRLLEGTTLSAKSTGASLWDCPSRPA